MKIMTAAMLATILLLNLKDSNLSETEKKWYLQLPACPCKNPDLNGVRTDDGWAKDKGDLATYHKGAVECFRSYPYVKTSVGKSGQQCCYDAKGDLIKSGSGAGTPDKVSTCSGEDRQGVMKVRTFALLGHYFKDVKPWKTAGAPENAWKTYNLEWVPSQGKCD